MAAEFQGQFQEAMREAEMADLKKTFDEVKDAASGFSGGNVMTSLQKDVNAALKIDDIDKPAPAAIDPPQTPTTPAAPTSETFVEATTHDAIAEPLAITREIPPEPVPQGALPAKAEPEPPAVSDVHRDAKAS
jgi:sec-independent protein translocase protein TatB